MTKETYKLSIEADLPKRVVEGKKFKVTYKIKNIGGRPLAKGSIKINIHWLMVGPAFTDDHTIQIKNLQPNESMNHTEQVFSASSGSTTFSVSAPFFSASDGIQILLYDIDGKKLTTGNVFASVRARSHEEIIESWALNVSASALIILILFQLLDWVIRYHDLF